MSRRFLHLVSFYGVANRGNGARHSQNDAVISSVFEHASSLGNQPVLICMDANATVEKSVTLQRILTTGKWHDVALTFSETEPDMTFCAKTTWNKIDKGVGVTRPDYIIGNAAAMALITSFSVRRDLPIKGHLGLQVTIRREFCMLQHRTFVPPTPFVPDEFQNLNPKEKDELFAGIADASKDEFDQAMKTQNINDAWSSLAKMGETKYTLFRKAPKPTSLDEINHRVLKQLILHHMPFLRSKVMFLKDAKLVSGCAPCDKWLNYSINRFAIIKSAVVSKISRKHLSFLKN